MTYILRKNIVRMLFESFISNDTVHFDKGLSKNFAVNTLKQKIHNLSEYEFQSHIPISNEKENYEFEQILMNGEVFNVSISHEIYEGKSYWKLVFGTVDTNGYERGNMVLDIIYETPEIEGLENFIEFANENGDEWNFDLIKQ